MNTLQQITSHIVILFLLGLTSCSLAQPPSATQNSGRIEIELSAAEGLLFYTRNKETALESIKVISVTLIYKKNVKEFYKEVREALAFEFERMDPKGHLFLTFYTENPKTLLHFVINRSENLLTEVSIVPVAKLDSYVLTARTLFPAHNLIENIKTDTKALVVLVDQAQTTASRQALTTIFKQLSNNVIKLHPDDSSTR